MSEKKKLYQCKCESPRFDAAQFFRKLGDELATGKLEFSQDGEENVVEVPGRLTMSVKAKQKLKDLGSKTGIEIELKWIEAAPEACED